MGYLLDVVLECKLFVIDCLRASFKCDMQS